MNSHRLAMAGVWQLPFAPRSQVGSNWTRMTTWLGADGTERCVIRHSGMRARTVRRQIGWTQRPN